MTGGCGFSITRAAGRGRGGASLRTIRLAGRAVLAILTLRYSVLADWVSATWTAPPPTTAQPAAQADSFARAIRTDMANVTPLFPPEERPVPTGHLPVRVHSTVQRRDAPTTPLTGIVASRIGKCRRLEGLRWQVCRNGTARPRSVSASGERARGAQSRAASGPESNSPPWGACGGARPRCCQPLSLRHRPRAVRATRPSWIR